MKKTVAAMADGRELIYYDEDESTVRDYPDLRNLPVTSTSSELRYDVIRDEWIAVASHRQGRIFMPPTAECPLCPTDADNQSEIPSPDYEIVVFENRFPSLASDVAEVEPLVEPGAELFARRPGVGRCEVVCFTSDHNTAFADLSPERVRMVLDVWTDRTRALSEMPEVEQVFPFENRGEEIGVTLTHPHGQIYAYPFVTPRTARMLDNAQRYQDATGTNLFDDVLALERSSGRRIIVDGEHWSAFVPAAARWPVEVHIYPDRRVPDLTALNEAERTEFPDIYLDVLKRLDGLYDQPLPYIAAWHQAPTHRDRDLAALHLEVFSVRRSADKLKYLAGSESGMDVFINDITPEMQADLLRAVDV
jgi:UDPglucose--hexose-1-phosphate uridylyltransferase